MLPYATSPLNFEKSDASLPKTLCVAHFIVIAGFVAFLVMGILASTGIFNFMGSMKAAYYSYGMYGGAALCFFSDIILCCKGRRASKGEVSFEEDSDSSGSLTNDLNSGVQRKNFLISNLNSNTRFNWARGEVSSEEDSDSRISLINDLDSDNYESNKGRLRIRCTREGLRLKPGFHLQSFANALLTGVTEVGYFAFSVTFLNNRLKKEQGIDCGGLARGYITDLFQGLLLNQFFNFPTPKLCIPARKTSSSGDDSESEKDFYQNIGRVLMFCYFSVSKYVTGRIFDDALFSAICCLTELEIKTSFEELSREVLLKMSFALRNVYDKQIYKTTDLLFQKEEISDDQICAAGEYLHKGGVLDDLKLENVNFDTKREILIQNRQRILNKLEDIAFNEVKQFLAPIHAIANGMYEICHLIQFNWDVDCNGIGIQGKEISDEIQGVFDRERIAECLQTGLVGKEVKTKLTWLKTWILTKATEEELQQLLICLVDATTLPLNCCITVQEQTNDYSPIPKTNTCFLSLQIAPMPIGFEDGLNDFTEEAFIGMIEEHFLKNNRSYSVI